MCLCTVNCDSKKNLPLTSYVNPFIGTGGHGHTYPGATRPFGMMQLSPDTRLSGWDGCSGYHYSDSFIYGFSHTHLSGTGISDYGDLLLMPTNKIVFNNGSDGKIGYRAAFSHDTEIAQPGYYKVHLDSTNIEVELTVSERSGMHKYQYPTPEQQLLILDLDHRDKLLAHNIELVDQFSIQGFRHSKAWASNQQLFFYISFSHPIKQTYFQVENHPFEATNTNNESKKVAIEFDNPNNTPVYISVGISAVDELGAKQNLVSEIQGKEFETLKKEAQNHWERELGKITIESNNKDRKVNFYTALYHTMLAPNLYQDTDGRYRGMDQNIHQTHDFEYYTVFSLWDTFRATHPLYTIIDQKRTTDFIKTFLAKYDEGGIIPIWDLSANYTGCMIGYHAVAVIADAYLKGIRAYDSTKAMKAMTHSANQTHLGLMDYTTKGFIAVENESESVSKTLEYAYDDWTIAQMAKAMGDMTTYNTFIRRAQNYKNVFDPETQFMRGRFRNTWFAPFDPYEVNFNYTEANAWQYSNYVPQDISGYIDLLGGKSVLERNLDTLFSTSENTFGRKQADITGLIGQYAHGNEPSHHMAYLYNFVNRPSKTQEKVHKILTTLYKNSPDGISGNEDCGQMSAWYVFSSMGFYPFTPASNTYVIGTPLFDKTKIHLENEKIFEIVAHDLSDTNKYIKKATLNNSSLNRTYIKHDEIIKGGRLEFFMTDSPSNWGTKQGQEPITKIEDHLIVPAPYIEKGNINFKESTWVGLNSADPNAEIYYRLNTTPFKKYTTPFKITQQTTLHTFAKRGKQKSQTIQTDFSKIDSELSIQLESSYANQYNGGGDNALIDGVFGTTDFRTGTWQGYFDESLSAIIDLSRQKTIHLVSLNFLKDQRSWIFLPTEVYCYGSNDGETFEIIDRINFETPKNDEGIEIITTKFRINKSYRFLKIIAKNLGPLPEWHLGNSHGGKSWIFVDEIKIE